mgnify:CR=1 FL=1
MTSGSIDQIETVTYLITYPWQHDKYNSIVRQPPSSRYSVAIGEEPFDFDSHHEGKHVFRPKSSHRKRVGNPVNTTQCPSTPSNQPSP